MNNQHFLLLSYRQGCHLDGRKEGLEEGMEKGMEEGFKESCQGLARVLDPVAIAERFKMSLEQVMDILGQKQIFLAAHIPDLRV